MNVELVRVQESEESALRQLLEPYNFWETVIGEYTGKRFEKCPVSAERWGGQALIFDHSEQPDQGNA